MALLVLRMLYWSALTYLACVADAASLQCFVSILGSDTLRHNPACAQVFGADLVNRMMDRRSSEALMRWMLAYPDG
ncbi:hypothetical protein C0Z20_05030 [Trinickia symbiotica]|uniref:Secreted protein n=1 Tax=Trinickia symbiotica TaxID=863227 RepID=A0A2N7X975_9BURK|nr:hypothetical protein C0Z20_05030 [Trinickia symbiotica]